jgi:transposase
MAGKPKRMSQVKQLIRLYEQGVAKKAIARKLGMSKNTVKAYIQKIESGELNSKSLLSLDEPVLEGKLFSGNPSYKDTRYENLKNNLSYYASELKKTGVTRQLLWNEYIQAYPDGYRYTQFCYHLAQYLIAKNPTMVLEHQPGDKLYIDYAGKKLSYINRETGEIIECEVFVACLPYSDYCFAMAVESQTIQDFVSALTCCLHNLGGVPQTLVPDNLKSAVVKSDKYEPGINKLLEDLANHYNTTVTPARVRKPRDKALVENQVKLVYSRVYAQLRNRQFFDIHSLNRAIKEKILAHNQTRMQQKDYCRQEKFISDEKPLLKPLPLNRFEIKYSTELTVDKNNYVFLYCDKHYYSVPYTYIGQKVKFIFTRSMVYIYAKGEQIAVHRRSFSKGRYTTVKEHLCSHHQHYLDRSPEYYIKRARRYSPVLGELAEYIFSQDKYPEQLYRSCDGLFSLRRKTDPEVFEKACTMAIEYENYSYGFILNILKNNMTGQITTEEIENPLPEHKNVRGAKYFE